MTNSNSVGTRYWGGALPDPCIELAERLSGAPSGAGGAIEGIDGRRSLALGNTAPDEINQMRVDRSPGGAAQPRLETDIESFDDCIDPLDAVAQAVENAGFTLAPVGDKGPDMPLRHGDGRAVRRPINRVAAADQLLERGHIGRQVAVGRC